MKEKPILFSGEMVRAVLDGRKTQTRRLVKNTGLYAIDSNVHGMTVAARELARLTSQCPFGQQGDRLWVRETFTEVTGPNRDEDPGEFRRQRLGVQYRASFEGKAPFPWTPSIHMPRWVSRITLEIGSIRVERLHDITAEDCRAEGHPPHPHLRLSQEAKDDAAHDWFMDLWTDLNGLESWRENPWVWAITFRRVEGGAE